MCEGKSCCAPGPTLPSPPRERQLDSPSKAPGIFYRTVACELSNSGQNIDRQLVQTLVRQPFLQDGVFVEGVCQQGRGALR
jgi:hypothetical protein